MTPAVGFGPDDASSRDMLASKQQSMPFATVETVMDHRSVKMGIMIRTRCSERDCRSGVANPGASPHDSTSHLKNRWIIVHPEVGVSGQENSVQLESQQGRPDERGAAVRRVSILHQRDSSRGLSFC